MQEKKAFSWVEWAYVLQMEVFFNLAYIALSLIIYLRATVTLNIFLLAVGGGRAVYFHCFCLHSCVNKRKEQATEQKVSLYADNLLLYISKQILYEPTTFPISVHGKMLLSGGFFCSLTFPGCYTSSTNAGCLWREQLFSFLYFHQPLQPFTTCFLPHLHSSPLSSLFFALCRLFSFPISSPLHDSIIYYSVCSHSHSRSRTLLSLQMVMMAR